MGMAAKGQKIVTWIDKGTGSWHVASNWDCTCVPTAQDTVVITHDTVIIGSGSMAFAKLLILKTIGPDTAALLVGNNAILGVRPEILILQKDTAIQIHNAELVNQGSIFIEESKVGIYLSPGRSILSNNDRIAMRFSKKGVVNHGSAENHIGALMEFHSMVGIVSQDACIENYGDFVNRGALSVHSVQIMGVLTRKPGAQFLNWGQIEMDTCQRAFEVTDTGDVLNLGRIILRNVAGAVRAQQKGIFSNAGYLSVNRTSQAGLSCYSGGQLFNSDTAIIRNVTEDGITIRGSFINSVTGFIQVSDVQGASHQGVDVGIENTLNNDGTLRIDSVDTEAGIFAGFGSLISNEGSIQIDIAQTGVLAEEAGVENFGAFGIEACAEGLHISDAMLDNSASGTFQISNCIDGLIIDQNAIFVNDGMTHISDISQVPLLVVETAELTNTGILDVSP